MKLVILAFFLTLSNCSFAQIWTDEDLYLPYYNLYNSSVGEYPLPEQVVITIPLDGDEFVDIASRTTFLWEPAINSNTYEIQIATDAGFSTIVFTANELVTTTYEVDAFGFLALTQYYWRVRGVNEGGNGVWSTTFTFTTTL